ncbi:MAG TPA: hypothetical protein VEN47_13945, partial [Myxococcota bacterium]|nr:hypothetical protein [Myxococcota bacterium]
MKPVRLLALAATCAVPAVSLRADSTPAPAPVCAVARDPQAVSSAGILHVLDLTNAVIRRWSLPAAAARPPLPVTSDVVAFASLSASDAVVLAHSTPPRLTLRPELATATEQPFVTLPPDAVLCGLGSSDQVVVVCIDQDQYMVFDAEGNLVGQQQIGDVTDTTTASWDGMAWDATSSTLFAIRVQGSSRTAIAVPLDASGALGDAQVVPLPDSLATLADELPTVSPDGSQLVAPDGLVLATDTLDVVTVPETSGGDVFLVGNDLFTVGAATQSGLAGCALSAQQATLLSNALLKPTLVRSAQWQGHDFLLRGDAATARLIPLAASDSGDLDADLAPDVQDVFPLDAVMVKDWDHDGVGDKDDAFPTDPHEWQDVDGDGIGDNEDAFDPDGDGVGGTADAFPDDPLEQTDTDKDGVGDHGDAFPNDPTRTVEPFGAITQVYAVDLSQSAALSGFPEPVASQGPAVFAVEESNRFILNLPSGEQLLGTTSPLGKSTQKLALHFDIATLSQLERDFAPVAAQIVASDTASPPPHLRLVPYTVLSDGVLRFTKTGVSIALRARFGYPR